jgi:hypothetical protein
MILHLAQPSCHGRLEVVRIVFPLEGVSIKNRCFVVKALFQLEFLGKLFIANVVDDIFIGDN